MAIEDDILALSRLVQRMATESGEPLGFDAQKWLQHWLHEPLPALGGLAPIETLVEPGGIEIVRTILARMQSGAYS